MGVKSFHELESASEFEDPPIVPPHAANIEVLSTGQQPSKIKNEVAYNY